MLNIQAADLLYALAIMIAMGGVGWFIGYGIADSIKGKLWFAIAFFIVTGVALVGHSLHLF
jgi:energy-converting hydrogenase Eha subunit E